MKMFACLLAVVLVAASVEANCPGDMEQINGKCYIFGTANSRADAQKECTDIDAENHLWIINDKLEMTNVMHHFSKRMVTPWAWTDGIRGEADEAGNDIWTWSNSGARLSFDPEHDATDCGGTCVNEDCGIESVGDCATISMSDAGDMSFQACDCTATFQYVCESPDEITWDCPADGFWPSADCSDLWYNCFGGHATPEYCGDGLIFNPAVNYCDYPENVDGCPQHSTVKSA